MNDWRLRLAWSNLCHKWLCHNLEKYKGRTISCFPTKADTVSRKSYKEKAFSPILNYILSKNIQHYVAKKIVPVVAALEIICLYFLVLYKTGVSKLLASPHHTGRRRVVLGHILNTLRQVITKIAHVLSKFMTLCWAAFIAILGHMRSTSRRLDTVSHAIF